MPTLNCALAGCTTALGVYCHVCGRTARRMPRVIYGWDLPPGGKVESDFKKPKEKKKGRR